MKQLLQNLRSGETRVEEVPIPTPQPGEVLVQTAASLVSAGTERTLVEFAGKSLLGKARSRPDLARQLLDKARREGWLTTLEAAFNRLDQPMPLGYSSAGTVAALGEGVRSLSAGQRVACAGGNWAVHAEYASVPRMLVAPLPDEVGFEEAAFTTLGAIALHGFRLAQTQIGEKVAVIGLGLLGLLAVQIARAAGCGVLGIDINERRVALAKQFGAEAVTRDLAEEAALSLSRGRGCDTVLICADTPSADPVELAGALARDRARVIALGAVGLHLPRKIYYEKELTFLNSRSYGPGRYDPGYEEAGQDYPAGYVRWTEGRNLEAFVDLLAERRVDVRPMITHRFPIEAAAPAYDLISGKTGEPFLGVLITYPGEKALPDAAGQRVKEAPAPVETAAARAKPVEEVRLGVLGAGNFASAVLLPAIKKVPQVRLVGIASASGLSASHAAEKFAFGYATAEESKILADETVNTVAILTRHHLHPAQIAAALAAGKHVFCEKPLAIDEAGLRQIEEARSSHPGLLLMGGFNRRFAPLAARLAEFLKDRQEPLVAHYRVNAGYLPRTHWLHDPQQGGGRIIGEGCHFIDFLTFLAGEPPRAVSAEALPDAGKYCEDNVLLTFEFPDGSLGSVSYLANGDKAFPKERVEIFCGGRVAVLDDFRSLELVRDGERQAVKSRLRQDKGHQAEWEAFAAALVQGGQPPIPDAHLFGVARASFAAVQALRGGGRVLIGS